MAMPRTKLRPKPGDRVTLAEIAELRDVPLSTLRNWVSRDGYNFPNHVAMRGKSRVWLWGKVRNYQPRKPGRPPLS